MELVKGDKIPFSGTAVFQSRSICVRQKYVCVFPWKDNVQYFYIFFFFFVLLISDACVYTDAIR